MWYRFEASNQETQYGWTADPAVAEAVVAELNERADPNSGPFYTWEALSESNDEDGGTGRPLRLHSGLLCDANTLAIGPVVDID